jgi:hypothetical protein
MKTLLALAGSLRYQAVDKHATMGCLNDDLQMDAGEAHLQHR